jgi:hypothetical protein
MSPSKPIPTCGNAAASTALPHPPKTSQNVPKNSATARFDRHAQPSRTEFERIALNLYENNLPFNSSTPFETKSPCGISPLGVKRSTSCGRICASPALAASGDIPA